MQDVDRGLLDAGDARLDGDGLRIGVVQARFNAEITDRMAAVCIAELHALGVEPSMVVHLQVPGALEIPVVLMALADRGDVDALIAIGCVIRGETYHFELVANESAAGVSRVALDHQVPIANAILTVDNDAQARSRIVDKARDAARAAVELANLLEDLP